MTVREMHELTSNLLVRAFLASTRVHKIAHGMAHVEPTNKQLKLILIVQYLSLLVCSPQSLQIRVDTDNHGEVRAKIGQFVLYVL